MLLIPGHRLRLVPFVRRSFSRLPLIPGMKIKGSVGVGVGVGLGGGGGGVGVGVAVGVGVGVGVG